MRTIQVLLMPLQQGYLAVAQGVGMFDSDRLDGFRLQIQEAIANEVGAQPFEMEFALSDDLRLRFPACTRCGGSREIEAEGIAAQYLASEFDAIDWTKRATKTCPSCEGMGVVIANF